MSQVIQKSAKPTIDEIESLIVRFNLLPPKLRLPALTVKSIDATNWQRSVKQSDTPIDQWTNEARMSLQKNLEGLPEDFQNYICGDEKSEVYPSTEFVGFDIRKVFNPPLQQIVARYEDYKKLRKQLRKVAKFAFKHPSWIRQFNRSKRDKPTKQTVFLTKRFEKKKLGDENYPIPFPNFTQFEIGEKGILKIKFDEFSKAVSGLDIRRIRKCQICKHIFWARRVEKFCCSKKCNLVFNTRLNRVINKTVEQREEDNRVKRGNRTHDFDQELLMLKNVGNRKP